MRLAFLLVLVFAFFASHARAADREMAGISFAQTTPVSMRAQPFVLSGLARREKNFISYYAIALYVPYGAKERDTLINALGPLKLRLVWITPALGAKAVGEYWRQAFKQAVPEKDALARIGSRIDAFIKPFGEVKYGDVTELEYDPDMGMKLIINGKHAGIFAGVEFNRALLHIWLGTHDSASAMRAGLLAGVP